MKQTLRRFILFNNGLMIAVPIIFLMVFAARLMFVQFENEIAAKNELIASTIASQLDDSLKAPENLLRQVDLIVLHRHGETVEHIQSQLDEIRSNVPYLESLEIVDSMGKTVMVSPYDRDYIGLDRGGLLFYRNAKENDVASWSSTTISVETGKPTVSLAVPGDSGYVIIGSLNLQRITELSNKIARNFGSWIRVVVTDDNGVFISNPDYAKVSQREVANYKSIVGNKIGIHGEALLVETADGRYILSSAIVSVKDWHVYVAQSYNDSLAPFKRVQMIFMLLMIVSILLATSNAVRRFANIAKHIDRLNSTARQIAGGNYDIYVQTSDFYEISELADNFNAMTEAIRRRDVDLNLLAYYDALTGLPNRPKMLEETRSRISACESQQKRSMMLILIDIDDFKNVNDSLGHAFGDSVLCAIVEKLTYFMPYAFLARTGADEFVYILDYPTEVPLIEDFLKHLMELFDEHILINGVSLFIGASIGIALYPEDGITEMELFRNADIAMSKAKQHPGNAYSFFYADLRDNVTKQLTIENEMRMSLRNSNDFSLVYQPMIDTQGDKIRGFEVLVRWKSIQFGNISPAELIPVAERSGLIIPLGSYILAEGCRTAAQINRRYKEDYIFSINVSAVQLQQPGFIDEVLKNLSQNDLAPDLFEIEITESVFLDSQGVMPILHRIKEKGIKISLDDFGTGYSSLSSLKDLPIDTLKIDRSFVNDLDDGSSGQIVSAIILLGHTLGLEIVAEGVETAGIMQKIQDYGCDIIQGYYYSKPMNFSEMIAYIEK